MNGQLPHLGDARWRAAIDAELLGEATAEQRAFLESHEPQGAEHRAEAEFLAALGSSESEQTDETVDEGILAAALDLYSQDTPAPAKPRSRVGLWVAAAAVLLCAGAVSTWAVTRGADTVAQVATRGFEHGLQARPDSRDAIAWQIDSGSAEVVPSPSGEVLPMLPIDQPLRVESELCASRPAHSVCLRRGSQVIARRSGALALVEGTATVRTEDAQSIPWVELGEGVRVEAAPHSVVVVEHRAAGWVVTVDLGVATVVETAVDTTRRDVQAGESLQRGLDDEEEVIEILEDFEDFEPARGAKGKRRPTKASGKASTMLAQARAHRRDGDREAAVATYERLIDKHPRTAAAHTASISLGQLQLERGNAKQALAAFRRYLKRGGALAEDAAYGEIRALRALGRNDAVRQAEAAFVQRYPDSRHSAKLGR